MYAANAFLSSRHAVDGFLASHFCDRELMHCRGGLLPPYPTIAPTGMVIDMTLLHLIKQ